MNETIECDFIFVPDGAPWPWDWVRRHPDNIVIPARFEGSAAFLRNLFGPQREDAPSARAAVGTGPATFQPTPSAHDARAAAPRDQPPPTDHWQDDAADRAVVERQDVARLSAMAGVPLKHRGGQFNSIADWPGQADLGAGLMPDDAGTGVMFAASVGQTQSDVTARRQQVTGPSGEQASVKPIPQLEAKYAAFFADQYSIVSPIASRLRVDPALLLGLSAYESGWGKPGMYNAKHNPFGATPNGFTAAGFASFKNAWENWARRWGSRVEGLGDDADAFVRALLADNTAVYGPTLSGDHHGGYNDVNPKWQSGVEDTILSVQRRLPRWIPSLETSR